MSSVYPYKSLWCGKYIEDCLIKKPLYHYYLAQKLCFWTGIIFIGVYVSVCVSVCLCVCLCVCESLYRLTQKVLDRFWWNLAGWCIMIKDSFLSMGLIGPIERIPRPFRILKYSYLTKVSGEFLKTSQNCVFYFSIDNFWA